MLQQQVMTDPQNVSQACTMLVRDIFIKRLDAVGQLHTGFPFGMADLISSQHAYSGV